MAGIRRSAALLAAEEGAFATLDLADGLPAVEADPAQVQQVVLNLVINAAEAIGDAAGTVTVRTAPAPAGRGGSGGGHVRRPGGVRHRAA